MTDRTFTIQLGEDERLMNLAVLGFALMRLPEGESASLISGLIAKMTKASGQSDDASPRQVGGVGPKQVGGVGPKQVGGVGPATRDYFEHDRQGQEKTSSPEGAELRKVKVLQTQEMPGKTDPSKRFLKVIVTQGTANCFDPQLWPHIVKHTGEEAELWFVQSGKYRNIVGIRA